MKTALICGVSGQDGAYLARLLLEKGYKVVGTSRDAEGAAFQNLAYLGIRDRVEVCSMVITDFRSTLQTITDADPDEIYNLAGQSSVGRSFGQPVETLESIAQGSLNLLESVRFLDRPIRLYNASSSECFGDTGGEAAKEDTPFRPRSPYAVAKAAAHWEVANYREAYGLFCCSGILFNHESPLRPERFVTRKITAAACRIAAGHETGLKLGSLEIRRDWGWAPEYVEAMWLMLQQEQPEDFVIATGESSSLQDFVDCAFSAVGLNWQDYVTSDPLFFRPSELWEGRGDVTKATRILGWTARYRMPDVARAMVEAELKAQNE